MKKMNKKKRPRSKLSAGFTARHSSSPDIVGDETLLGYSQDEEESFDDDIYELFQKPKHDSLHVQNGMYRISDWSRAGLGQNQEYRYGSARYEPKLEHILKI